MSRVAETKPAESEKIYREMCSSLVSAVGQNDDNSGTGSFCSVRIRNRGRGATNREAIQSGYVLHEIWRAGLGTNQDLLLQLR